MSHFTKVDTEITDRDCLVKALKAMGLDVTVHETATTLHGYSGTRKAHVIVKRRSFNGEYGDIGFELKDGKFTIHADAYDIRKIDQKQMKRLYAEQKLIKEAARRGFRVLKRRVKGNKILMTLKRAY